MSDASSDTRPAHYKRIGSIVEGLTFVLFVGTLTSQTPYVMAAAVIWTIMALALPLIWRGAFTFSVQRTQSQEVSLESGLREPIALSTLGMMSLVLGIVGAIASWGAPLFVVISEAAVLGCVLFAATCAVDPPMRTAKQMAFLAVECAFWGVGARAAIVGLLPS
jgi:hypothetical protein